MSTPLRLVALLALACAGPAVAQTAPAERTWTDPPVRGAASSAGQPVSEPPQAVAKAPNKAAAAKPFATEAAGARPPRVRTSPKPTVAEVRSVRRTPKARVAAAPRRTIAIRTLTPTRPDLRTAPPRVVHVGRAFVRPVRDDFIAPPPPPRGFYAVDPRAQRIRQAEAAGYLVVRRSTVATPDGRLLYGYRPYDSDDGDD